MVPMISVCALMILRWGYRAAFYGRQSCLVHDDFQSLVASDGDRFSGTIDEAWLMRGAMMLRRSLAPSLRISCWIEACMLHRTARDAE